MKILFIGDIYGDAGINFLLERLPELRQTYQPILIISNAENAANRRGMTMAIYKKLMSAGISLLTAVNHTWINLELETFIHEVSIIISPINDGSTTGVSYKIIN